MRHTKLTMTTKNSAGTHRRAASSKCTSHKSRCVFIFSSSSSLLLIAVQIHLEIVVWYTHFSTIMNDGLLAVPSLLHFSTFLFVCPSFCVYAVHLLQSTQSFHLALLSFITAVLCLFILYFAWFAFKETETLSSSSSSSTQCNRRCRCRIVVKLKNSTSTTVIQLTLWFEKGQFYFT